MKKTLSIVLSLVMIISTLAIAPFTAKADDDVGSCGENSWWEILPFTNALQINGSGDIDDMEANKQPWVKYKDVIEEVYISRDITSIGAYAFYGFKNLKNVLIPNGVTTIGLQAFGECTGLERLIIPSSVTNIYSYAFWDTNCDIYYSGTASSTNNWGAKSLKRNYAGENIKFSIDGTTLALIGTGTTFDWNALYSIYSPWYNNNIEKVIIGNGITRIGDSAFCFMDSIEEVVMADSVKEVGKYSFSYTYSLNKIRLSENLESIGESAFEDSGLESIQLNNGLKEIGDYAFYGTGLKSIVIPSTVQVIGESAFDDCELLESVQLNNGLKEIGENAFYGTALKSITIPSTVETIGESAFEDCASLGNIELNYGLKEIGCYAFSNVSAKSIYVPCSATKIDEYAFSGMDAVYYTGSATDPYEENWGAKQVLPNTTTKGHKTTTTVTKATTSKNGAKVTKCTVCGTQTAKSTIYYPKTITLSATKYTYDGKVKKPTVKVVDANGKTIAATNYTVTYPSGMKNVGKYTVKIAFKGNYSGTVSKTYTIVPKTTSISSLTAASKGFTVKWKKQATQTTGYQIQIATDSKFTKGVKSYDVTKNTTLSKKITKLTGKKKYYVRIRTYKTVSGTKYYSSWSGSKTVTTKK